MKIIINLIAILTICLTSFIFCRELEVEFISDSPWLYGNYWLGGTSFWNNSIAIGSGFAGQSTLDSTESVNIDIRFSTHADSQSVVPVYASTPYTAASPGITGEFLGMGTFPGTAWDVSNPNSPRRINLCFFEQSGDNLIWNPVNAANGNYEYLLIMLSDYDEGAMYMEEEDLKAYNMDVQYFCWLKKKAGQTWFGSEPAVLQFRNFWDIEFNAEPGDNQINLDWQHENQDAEIVEIDHYEIYRGLNNAPDSLIAEIDVGVNSYLDSDVINLTTYYYKVIGLNNAGEPIVVSDVIMSTPFLVAFNTEFISNWNGSNDNPYLGWGITTYNDVWGYTDGEGTEYALLGAWNGTHIIDISSNPSHPLEVGFISGSFSTHRDIKTYGDYMYIGTEANIPDPDSDDDFITPQGIQVVDLSDPHNPILVNEWDLIDQSHNIMEYNGYLYIIGSSSDVNEDGNTSNVIVLDLADPSNPIYVGEWSGHYIHDVCFKDNILYGCGIQTNTGGYDDKMFALDITHPESIFEIHQWEGVFAAHACWVSEDGNTLYTGQETTNGNIKSWDVTEVENGNVNLLDEWTPPGGENWSAHNLFVKGNYLYMSYYVYGLQILDISDPTNMVYVGHYDTFVESSSSGIFDGAWGAYPFFNSQKVIISDRSTGLYVINHGLCVYDECGICDGNGYVDWTCNDDAGSCWDIADGYCDCNGNVLDCNDTCGGSAVIDCDGTCGGDNTICFGCMDDSACNYDIDATIEGECEYPEENYDCEGNLLSLHGNRIPKKFTIDHIYPNPFNPLATISFSIPELGFTTITAYDITGKKLETLTNKVLQVGYHTVSWNALSYPSGVYLISMDSGGFTQTQKVVLLK